MAAVDALHAAGGLPWWATLGALGVAVRTAALPLSLKGARAGGAALPLLRRARAELAAAPLPRGLAAGAPHPVPTPRELAARFHALRRAAGAPHPLWVLAAPAVQLPLFIGAMATIRGMAARPWPGLEAGGAAWFPDLTLPALDLAALAAPLGAAGAALPVAIALATFANVDGALGAPLRRLEAEAAAAANASAESADSSAGAGDGNTAVQAWALGKVKLVLEWVTVPLFITALQLPHATLCYWAASSTAALAQGRALRALAARRALGLEANGSGNGGSSKAAPAPQSLELPPEAARLLVCAAELRARGDGAAAAVELEAARAAAPGHPRVLYALGQVRGAIGEWEAAAAAYSAAAAGEPEPAQRARAWFGAGVAAHEAGDAGGAAAALAAAAAEPGAGPQLRVRALVAAAQLAAEGGARDEAADLLRRAAELEPSVADVFLKPLLEGGALPMPAGAGVKRDGGGGGGGGGGGHVHGPGCGHDH
jgi:tetratricopeptide (TPR) repeat protein